MIPGFAFSVSSASDKSLRSTIIGGIFLGKDIEFMKTQATKIHRLLGGNSNSFDAFLLVNGMKTLEVRMDRHCHNAMEVAGFLDGHEAVAKVN